MILLLCFAFCLIDHVICGCMQVSGVRLNKIFEDLPPES